MCECPAAADHSPAFLPSLTLFLIPFLLLLLFLLLLSLPVLLLLLFFLLPLLSLLPPSLLYSVVLE